MIGERVAPATTALRSVRASWGTRVVEMTGSALHICIDPLSAPRRTRVTIALCEKLTDAEITYSGTNLVLHYSAKDASCITWT